MAETNLNLNLTTSEGSAPLFQEALNRHIITRAKSKLVHHQFGQKTKIPKGKTKTITWDKLNPLPKATTPLTEGVTPTGTSLSIQRVTAEPLQYGAYISTSDEFDFYKNDPSPEVLRINELLADNAGETQDSLTADILSSGTNVQYAGGVEARELLLDSDNYLTVEDVRKAVRTLKRNKAQPIGKDFVAIVDPDVAFDIMSDSAWENVKTYCDPKDMYSGELGRLYGVRFVETPDAKLFKGDDTILGRPNLTASGAQNSNLYIQEGLTQEEASALSMKKILVNGTSYKVVSATAGDAGDAYVMCDKQVTSVLPGTKIYSGEGGANGQTVHSTLVIGKDAYGVTDPKENLQTIIKPLGSAGSADPLNQRGTMGWKCHHLAKILVEEYMVRIESLASGTMR